MTINKPSRYLQTMDEFLGHWADVDAALAPGALILNGTYGLAQLQADRDALSDQITALVHKTNVLEGHRTDRDNQKPQRRERMRQIRGFVKGVLSDSVFPGQLPPLIYDGSHSGKWIIAMDEFAHLWSQIEAAPPVGFVPPMLLTGGYSLVDFNADVLSLKNTFGDITVAEQDADREHDAREALYTNVRSQLVRYRRAVPGMFASTSPLVTSLPRLSPKRRRKVVDVAD